MLLRPVPVIPLIVVAVIPPGVVQFLVIAFTLALTDHLPRHGARILP